MKTTRQWETPPSARPLPHALPAELHGNGKPFYSERPHCRLPFAYICNFDVSSTTRASRQATRLAVCSAITLRGRSRVPWFEWMPARLGRREKSFNIAICPSTQGLPQQQVHAQMGCSKWSILTFSHPKDIFCTPRRGAQTRCSKRPFPRINGSLRCVS